MKTIQEMAREAGICTWLKPPKDVIERLEAFAALVREDAQRKPLTDKEIMAIGKELGLKCRLGGNSNIDFDYARAIEAAHGITAATQLKE